MDHPVAIRKTLGEAFKVAMTDRNATSTKTMAIITKTPSIAMPRRLETDVCAACRDYGSRRSKRHDAYDITKGKAYAPPHKCWESGSVQDSIVRKLVTV